VTEKWGVRVNRLELKDITPPQEIQRAMEKQMQAERNKRAAVLTAEGQKQAAVLRAEGLRQALILQSEGERQAAILRAEGEAQALVTVQEATARAIALIFRAVNMAGATPEALQYQYMQMLPRLAENPANKVIVVPSDMGSLAGQVPTLVKAVRGDQRGAPAGSLERPTAVLADGAVGRPAGLLPRTAP
jgi:regulator of protease activity HflC (stomatin/prohibitin superfamily)